MSEFQDVLRFYTLLSLQRDLKRSDWQRLGLPHYDTLVREVEEEIEKGKGILEVKRPS